MIHPPQLTYCGLTIVVDRSRHDEDYLMSGYAGQTFDSILHPISRLECYVASSDENFLLSEGTKIILLLGEDAHRKFGRPNTNLLEQRGSPYTTYVAIKNVIAISSFMPQDAYDQKNYDDENEDGPSEDKQENEQSAKTHSKTRRVNWQWWLTKDINKVKRLLKSRGELKRYPISSVMTYSNSDQICKTLKNTKNGNLYFDIETSKELELTCFGFSFGVDPAISKYVSINLQTYVVPWKLYDGSYAYSDSQLHLILQSLAIAFRDNCVVVHNSMFDLFVMAFRYKIPFPTKVFDTMLGWHRCYPEVEKSLGHLITYFFDEPFHKNDAGYKPYNAKQQSDLWRYNAKDIISLVGIKEELDKEIILRGAGKSVEQVNNSIIPYLTMTFKGIRIDVPKLKERYNELEKSATQLTRCLNIVTGREINPRSPKQVSSYLYDNLNLPKPDKDPTNEKQLLKILVKKNVPSIKLIIAIRGKSKLASSIKYVPWCGDRLTTAYHLTGAETFRPSSRALARWRPHFYGFGTNAQNITKSMRDLYIPDNGKIFVQPDQSGAEALIVAYLCRSGKFRALFLNNIKPHVFVAMHVFKNVWKKALPHLDIDKFCLSKIENLTSLEGWAELDKTIKDSDKGPSDKRYYFIAKQICHSSNYDIKAPTFQLNTLLKSEGSIALTTKQCNEFLNLYHSLFPEIREWHQDIIHQLKENRRLENLFGFPRIFNGHMGDSLYKKGYAFIPQSTVACITHIAATNLHNFITKQKLDWDILTTTYDSYLIQCPINEKEECSTVAKGFMEQELSYKGTTFRMKSEVTTGGNWAL